MNVSFRQRGNTRIVDVAGGVDLRTSPLLRQSLFKTLGEAQKVALNLSAISYIDSAGIAVLLEALQESQRLHHEFVLFGMNSIVHDVFRITHVVRVFQVVDTEEQALGAENSHAGPGAVKELLTLTLNAGSAAGTAESPNEPPLARHSTASVFLTPPKPTPALPGCSPTPTRSTCTRIGRQGLNVVTGSQENGLEIVRMQRRT